MNENFESTGQWTFQFYLREGGENQSTWRKPLTTSPQNRYRIIINHCQNWGSKIGGQFAWSERASSSLRNGAYS